LYFLSFSCVRHFKSIFKFEINRWKFDQTGKCVDIPYNKENAKIPENAKTKVWKSVEQNQLIMIWYHAENEEPKWFPHHIKEVDEGRFIRHGRSSQFIRCHPQVKFQHKFFNIIIIGSP